MQAATYIESRKLLDKHLRHSLSIIYYLALAASVLLVSFCVINPSGLLFTCSVTALVFLVVDILFTLKGNLPINKVINTWTASRYPDNWKEYRAKWLNIYTIRQAANVIGFTSLLAGIVFGFN
jgi:hypothetical protein